MQHLGGAVVSEMTRLSTLSDIIQSQNEKTLSGYECLKQSEACAFGL